MSFFFIGLEQVLEPLNLILLIGGSFIGVMVGAIPGLNSAIIIALVLPLTIAFTPIQAFVGMTSLYCGSIYGGSISAILINVPGTPEACATTFDGYALTQKGQAGKALGAAILASFIGGFASVWFLIFLSPQLAKFALVFGPAEYFSLGVLGVSTVIGLSPKSQLKGLFSGFVGLLTATVGVDTMTAYARFTFGIDALEAGIDFIPMIIGLFAVGEILSRAERIKVWRDPDVDMSLAARLPSFAEMWPLKWLLASCVFLGVLIGIIPGAGATIAAFLAYSLAAQFSRRGHEFGTGVLEGVVAPESANNATTGGAMIPLLSLGIPGSGTTAVLLVALLFHGLTPGPILFVKSPTLIYAIFVGMLFANILILPMGWLGVKIFAHVVRIKYRILGPLIILVCTAGSYGATNDIIGVWTMFFFGIVGYLFTRYDIPLSPMILGGVLGKMIEENYHRTVSITGSLTGVLDRTIPTLVLLSVVIILVAYPLAGWWAKRRNATGAAPQAGRAEPADASRELRKRRHSVVLFSVSLLVWLFLSNEVRGFSTARAYKGVEVWPSIVLTSLIVLTVVILWREVAALLRLRVRAAAAKGVDAARGSLFGALGIFLLYLILIPVLGFPIASVAFIVSLMMLLGETRWSVLAPVGILSTLSVYIIFAKFLAVWFPRGMGIFATITETVF
jgi:putative tricarboxylic transport membrane protein